MYASPAIHYLAFVIVVAWDGMRPDDNGCPRRFRPRFSTIKRGIDFVGELRGAGFERRYLFGLDSPHELDGRVLFEAMAGDSAPQRAVTQTLEVAHKFPSDQWYQHLRISRVCDTTYIDEGNGAFTERCIATHSI